MPLVLGARNDVAAKDRPKPIDRSGLSATDWLAIAVDNAFRQVHFACVDADERARKLARLDALLDDPDLARTHPPDDPDRQDAIARHIELHYERQRFVMEARGAAKEAARMWEKLPDDWRAWLRDGFALGWHDSPAWSLALSDPLLARLGFWQEAGWAWRNRESTEVPPCPF